MGFIYFHWSLVPTSNSACQGKCAGVRNRLQKFISLHSPATIHCCSALVANLVLTLPSFLESFHFTSRGLLCAAFEGFLLSLCNVPQNCSFLWNPKSCTRMPFVRITLIQCKFKLKRHRRSQVIWQQVPSYKMPNAFESLGRSA